MVRLNDFKEDRLVLAVYEACARRKAAEPRRDYLGISSLGKPCERALWLALNGAEPMPVDGRTARIFDNGHSREEIIISDLEAAGFSVDGRQVEYSDFGGKLKGHCDGIIHGITRRPHILEIKTANDANFKVMKKGGIKAKPTYEVQVHCYMGYAKLERALFVVENKNNQELYTERVYFSREMFEAAKAKARRIIEATDPPAKIENETECRWCDYALVCDNPPTIAPLKETACPGCTYYLPAPQLKCGTDEVVSVLRCIISTLSPLPPADQEQIRGQGYKLLEQALNVRPDLNIPLTVLYGKAKTPANKFMQILEYIFNLTNGWCEHSYFDSRDPMTCGFQGKAGAADWCLHQKYKAIIHNPIGCADRATEEVPF
ncbi:hypothetical protein C4J81_17250 [Deltaproteobacteria bacterium Smac51]|nr:hypothetical protein C4J81_17250 [Deltaproteobacteria bacterium Smac51]